MRRRRILRILAATGGLALLPGPEAAGGRLHHRWRGAALGAQAQIDLWLEDRARALRLVRLALAEIDRLERIFSLQRQDSALAALNRDGRLRHPPLELVAVLSAARRVAALTGGAFDVTVQPLWRLYADHFRDPRGDPAGPAPRAIEALRARVDHRALELEPGLVRLARPGMAVTLNGIAQGFIADRVAGLMQAEGVTSVLLDLGEIAAVGQAPGGADWRVRAGTGGPVLALAWGAVATSSPGALAFDPGRRFAHILDPRTLRPSPGAGTVTVMADSAMIADALSTALAVRPHPLPPGHGLGVRRIVLAG